MCVLVLLLILPSAIRVVQKNTGAQLGGQIMLETVPKESFGTWT